MKTPFMLLLITTLAATVASADPVSLMPLTGTTIDGTPGSTIGWGYEIINTTADWYVPFSLSPPSILSTDGILTTLFDYPAVGPGDTVSESYNGIQGLLAFTLSGSLSPGTTLSLGNVFLTGEFFAENPFTDPSATDLGAAPNVTAPIAVNVVSSVTPIPEPSMLWVLMGICLVLLIHGWYQRSQRDHA
jgi:hypothetical protein